MCGRPLRPHKPSPTTASPTIHTEKVANGHLSKGSNHADRIVARLKRDYPDIADRLAGVFSLVYTIRPCDTGPLRCGARPRTFSPGGVRGHRGDSTIPGRWTMDDSDAIAAAQATIEALEAKLAAAHEREPALNERRRQVGYRLHVETDPKARTELQRLNHDCAGLAGEILSLEGALTTAKDRLADAVREAEAERQRAVAVHLRERTRDLYKEAATLDDLLGRALAAYQQFKADARELSLTADNRPSPGLIDVAARQALKATLLATGIVESMAPTERRSFSEIASTWCSGFDAWASHVLDGDSETEEAA